MRRACWSWNPPPATRCGSICGKPCPNGIRSRSVTQCSGVRRWCVSHNRQSAGGSGKRPPGRKTEESAQEDGRLTEALDIYQQLVQGKPGIHGAEALGQRARSRRLWSDDAETSEGILDCDCEGDPLDVLGDEL